MDVFEVTPEFELEPLSASCSNETVYTLPELFNSAGEQYKFEVSLSNLTEEIALYDPETQQIWLFNWLIKDTHEGDHFVKVSLSYGFGDF